MPRTYKAPRYWTPELTAELVRRYPHESSNDIAASLGMPVSRVRNRANHLGLRKAPGWVADRARAAIQDPAHPFHVKRFAKGHNTWNKGKAGSTGRHPNTARHHFQPGGLHGAALANSLPLGSYSLNEDGLLRVKVSMQPGPQHHRWHMVHRMVWESAHGPVPAGHLVVFKPGQRTHVLEEITLDRLECITRAENVRRNSVHRLGAELQRVAQLRGCITRQINRRLRERQQDTPTSDIP